MQIYIDENIPYGIDFFKGFGDVITFSGRDVTAEQIKSADVLLVRSITQVNESLLKLNQQIKFVGTATIGTDHIDLEYLDKRGIKFSSAPGCNKISVAEYVLSALLILSEKQQFNLTEKTVAIVGAGNTGSAVYKVLTAMGVACKLYDPPLRNSGDPRQFCDFSDVLAADIITLHVPKTLQGEFKTYHLFNHDVLSQLSPEQVLINASRGEVVDNAALLILATQAKTPTLVLDVWENEPDINKALLPFVELATPHIAGYSLDGKVRGTEMLYHSLCKLLSKTPSLSSHDFIDSANIQEILLNDDLTLDLVKPLVHLIYDVRRDDALFRKKVHETNGFDQMRKNYIERRELSTLTLNFSAKMDHTLSAIDWQQLGFTLSNKMKDNK